MNDYRVQGIPGPLVAQFWHFAEPYIKRALDHASGEFLPEDLKVRCINRDCQLWLAILGDRVVGAGTTEIVQYPQKRHCRIITLAGSQSQEWAEQANILIEAWAKAQGCEALEAITRRGFIPKLEKIGYRHQQAVMIKPLKSDHDLQPTLA